MTAALPVPEQHRWDPVFVLREYELRQDTTLLETSRFCDDVWSLTPASHQLHMRALTLNFDTIPRQYRRLTKELFCAYLAMPLPAGEERLATSTARGEFVEIRRFTTWLTDLRGSPELVSLTGQDIGAYAAHVRDQLRNPMSASRAQAAVRRIWRYRSVLPGDRLTFDPQHVDGWPARDKGRRGENRRARLPEPVMGPLIVWATRFVDVFSADILATIGERTKLRQSHSSIPGTNEDGLDRLSALEQLLARHLDENRPLPGRDGAVNYTFLASSVAVSRTSITRNASYRERIEAAAAVVGIENDTFFYTPVRMQLDGRSWLDKISNYCGDGSLPVLARLLQTACYILISFYSGMRDSEVKHLNRGCLLIERDPDGVAYRWKVQSRAFKGERSARGVPAVWVVGEPAARAVQVLEKLQPQHTDILLQSLPYGGGWAEEHGGRAMNNTATNLWLNRFVRWVNDYCAARGRLDGLPNIDGHPWRLKTSHFRRTLAWFIARRPGGSIAGAIAFRHHSIQMFEGYAGTSESGFRAEVESEMALARGEQLMDLADTHHHAGFAGPAADEAAKSLERFALIADGFAGNVVSDERRLKRLMERYDPAVYPGTYVTCVYRHENALCRRGDTASSSPELAACKPLTCRNVALTADNIGAWRHEIVKIDQQLAQRPLLPPLLQHRIQQRRTDLSNFLDRHPVGQP